MCSAVAVTGGLVLTDAHGSVVPQDILVWNGEIAALLPPGSPLPEGHVRHDATGHIVIPGLINAHYHSHDVLARGLFEDLPLEVWIALAIFPPGREPDPREVHLRTLLGAAENLLNGTTLVQDMMGCGPGGEEAVAAALSAYDEIGIRCVMSLQVGDRPAIDCLPGIAGRLPRDLHPLISGTPPPVEDILAFVRHPFDGSPRPRLHWAIAPGSPQRCTLPLLAGLGELAREHDLPLVTHVNESKLQVFLARDLYAPLGGSVLDYLAAAGVLESRTVMAHGVWFSPEEIARIGEAGAKVVTNPASNLKLKNGIAPHECLLAHGVGLAIGCDNVSAGDSQNMLEAMRLLGWLASGKGPDPTAIDARTILDCATRGGAQALRLGDVTGTISPGKRADLTILDLATPAFLPLNDPQRQLVYAESGRSVRDVMVDGEFVVRDGRLTRVNLRDVIAEAHDLLTATQRDYRAHRDRMAPIIGHITALVREHGRRPLPFNRWPASVPA